MREGGSAEGGGYGWAFLDGSGGRRPRVAGPGRVCGGPDDMLKDGLTDARRLGPDGLVTVSETPTTVWWPDPEPVAAAETLAMYDAFLEAAS